MCNMNSAAEVLAKQTELANAESHLDTLLFGDVSGFPMAGNPAETDAKKKVAALRAEVATMQEIVGGKVFLIPEYNVVVLAEKLAKLNKRADKLGVEPVAYTAHETIEKQTGKNAYGEPEYTLFQHVAVRGTSPKLAGWQFAATLEHDENGVIVRRLPGLDESVNLTAYRNADPANCDQCHQRRRRIDTYVVLHENGDLRQVGSSCLKDFLGGQSPERIAQWLSFVADLLDALEDSDSEFYGGDRAPAREHALTYLTHVACMIRENGWTSRGSANNYGGYATADAASNNLFNQRGRKTDRQGVPLWTDPTDDDAAKAQAAIDHVRALEEADLESDYVYNLFTSLKGESIATRQFGIAASAISFYDKAVQAKVEKAKRAVSNFVGAEKEKLTLQVTVSRIVPIDGAYGTTFLYIMIDADGNQIKWFSSREIDGMDAEATGMITGTVKKLEDDARYGKSTILTRCKFAA